MPRKTRTRKTPTSAKSAKSSQGPAAPATGLLRDRGAARPLTSLLFLSPLLAFYVIGLNWVRPDLAARADILIRQGLHWLGVSGYLAPTWMVVLTLLVWHLVRRDPWEISWRLLGLMAAETLLLAVPLLAMLFGFLAAALGDIPQIQPGLPAEPTRWLAVAMTSIGAGIFEELLFRLLMVGGTLFVLRQAFKENSAGAMVAVVLIAAAIFSGAHVLDRPQHFAWDKFLYRAAAGVYLGLVFVYRGFGVAVGVHVCFNMVVQAVEVQA
jgi:hypothetical protein